VILLRYKQTEENGNLLVNYMNVMLNFAKFDKHWKLNGIAVDYFDYVYQNPTPSLRMQCRTASVCDADGQRLQNDVTSGSASLRLPYGSDWRRRDRQMDERPE